MNGPTSPITDEHRDLIARFVHAGDGLSDDELGRLVDALCEVPMLADELRDQLVVHDLLGQQLVVGRGDFVAQIEQRLHDERTGMSGGLSSIADLLPAVDAARLDEDLEPDEATDLGTATPTDESLDLRAHALREMEQWQRSARRARTRTLAAGFAAVLLAGLGLTLWMLTSRPDHGELLPGRGVQLARVEAEATEPTEPVTLQPGDRISTDGEHSATIRYRDGSILEIRPNTTVAVVGRTNGVGKVVDVESGDITATVSPQPQGRPMILRTPVARARVVGTEFELHVREGNTRLDVLEGSVELVRLGDDSRVMVGADEFAVATNGAVGVPLRTQPVAFPGPTWTRVDPADVGLDAEQLRTFGEAVGGSGCVVRNGRLVHTWGDPSQRGMGSRVTDPLFAHLVFLAIERDEIEGLDERVARRGAPQLAALGVDDFDRLGKDAGITWRQLVNHTSGYGTTDEPGTAFRLDGPSTALLADAIVRNVFEADWATIDNAILKPHLTGPLQCEDRPTLNGDPDGLLRISPRDLARFGLLCLHEGKWRERRPLDRRFAAIATSHPVSNGIPVSTGEPGPTIADQRDLGGDGARDHFGSHSYGWWLNGVDRHRNRMWPSAPHDTYAALATRAEEGLVVIPSLDLVVAYTAAKPREWSPGDGNPLDGLLGLLVEATQPK